MRLREQSLRHLLSIPAGQRISIARLKIDPIWDPIGNRQDFQQILSGPEQIGPKSSFDGGSEIFAELKRRNVYKVAVAYVVMAWLLFRRRHFVPDVRSAGMGDEGLCHGRRRRFSHRADSGLGLELTPDGLKRTENELPTRHP